MDYDNALNVSEFQLSGLKGSVKNRHWLWHVPGVLPPELTAAIVDSVCNLDQKCRGMFQKQLGREHAPVLFFRWTPRAAI